MDAQTVKETFALTAIGVGMVGPAVLNFIPYEWWNPERAKLLDPEQKEPLNPPRPTQVQKNKMHSGILAHDIGTGS
jgi:hypothetical protein